MKTGFRALQRIGNEFRFMQHHVVIAFVMGDSLSNTNLCSTFLSSKAARICRFCDVNLKDSDRHDFHCSFIKLKHLKQVSSYFMKSNNLKEKEYLNLVAKSISMHISNNPWFDLDYGANEYGLLSATPTDMMHLFDLGIIKYVVECFIQTMTDSTRMKLDNYMSQSFQSHRSSESKHQLRINFTKGITSVSMLTAKEWSGLLFSIFQCLLTHKGS